MRFRTLAAALVMLMAAAGCNSGGGPHLQSPSPSSRSPSRSDSSSVNPTPTTLSPIPTPTVAKIAQPAVDAYIALAQQLAKAGLDPAHADLAKINQYVIPAVQEQIDAQFTAMAKAGIAYRGQPDDPNIKVIGPPNLSTMVLASCPVPSRTDPAVEYFVATGKPVPVPSPPLPAYRKVITMQLDHGSWTLAEIQLDKATLCPS